MATNTTNYNLTKPDYEDDADIKDLNDNFDAIDAQMKANETATHSFLPNISGSTTIAAYVNELSKGHYKAFILYNSVPSDSPVASSNAFVEIFVYSATTAMVRLIPVGTTTDNKFFIITKSSGNWRTWNKFEGTAVT